MPTRTDPVQLVREFNRFWTRVIGVLDAGLAGTTHSLTEARVLYELAHRGEARVADLRRDLDLDAGYLSRILARLSEAGLTDRERSAADTRCQVARLTPAGREAFAALDEQQAATVRELLDPLGGERRDALVRALRDIRRQFDGKDSGVRAVVLRAPEPGDLGWVVSRHGALYASEYGWDATFEALVARLVADFASAADPRSAAWIAEVDGERAGSVFCMPSEGDPSTARLRLLLVEPGARGAGVGARLVEECLRFARRHGYRRITLWTNDVLSAARRIYQQAGFHLDDEKAHHSFGAHLVGQDWSRDL